MVNQLPSGAQWRAHGRGTPVTLVVPGLGATEGEARLPASGLPGTRVVVTLPGHATAPPAPAGYWTYPRVARDVAEIADRVGATSAIGVSLGAGALTALLAGQPDRFERVALLLPATLDRLREPPAMWHYERLADAVEANDPAALADLVAADLPDGIEVGNYVRDRVAALLRLGAALRALPDQTPLSGPAERAALARVRVPVLVVAATDDPLHPAGVAGAVAAALPAGRLAQLPSAAPLLTHRRQVRALLTDFLGGHEPLAGRTAPAEPEVPAAGDVAGGHASWAGDVKTG
ncbi:alpha/beta fold hydrolase [Goodfellowiella coeruleoviolacea]|uniref:Lysophospholipase, alpha-beta hydrolase superfamily n=1 Tax=Goodfellowiella coeruleoviolacea TaxID=334858 RepID=A0AAE3GD52_9PSEU|nr:alpha/beta hydrolase [Goodfellowiella coeruleoviolacea]MCP2166036.1 Lysophospholipase, alpha-beta hydrolase superfamily [Goodfellowiella coeruleoviolacea]